MCTGITSVLFELRQHFKVFIMIQASIWFNLNMKGWACSNLEFFYYLKPAGVSGSINQIYTPPDMQFRRGGEGGFGQFQENLIRHIN